jgi:hypothetical protein
VHVVYGCGCIARLLILHEPEASVLAGGVVQRDVDVLQLAKGQEGCMQRRIVDSLLQPAHVQGGLGVAALALNRY